MMVLIGLATCQNRFFLTYSRFFQPRKLSPPACYQKKWKFQWRNIHKLSFSIEDDCFTLNLDDDDCNLDDDDWDHWDIKRERVMKIKTIKFQDFVNRVLLYHNQETTIDEFLLKIWDYSELFDVTTWISAAVVKKVKLLDFHVDNYFDCDEPHYQLPRSLFICETLEALTLCHGVILNVPNLVFLPNLKTLHLEYVIYECDESVRTLISGCSSLKTLCIRRCKYDNVVTFTISSPTLTKLSFIYDRVVDFPEGYDYKLEIYAPALSCFYLSDGLFRDFCVEGLSSLDIAKIEIHRLRFGWEDDEDEEDGELEMIDYDRRAKTIAKLFQGVDNVKELCLDCKAFEVLSRQVELPSFWRLTSLSVNAQYCGWNSLLNLVQSSNKLKSLTFYKVKGHQEGHVTCWSQPEKVPICFLSCFESMILSFNELEDELAMVAYILENAKVLRKMTINYQSVVSEETKLQLFQKISKFPRRSENCEVTVS